MSRANAQTVSPPPRCRGRSRTGLACLRNATTGDGFCISHRRRLWLVPPPR